MEYRNLAENLKDYTIKIRREIHMNPEPALFEFNTSNIVKRELDAIRVPYETVSETGVLATIEGKYGGKTVALRADMDALELEELNDVPYKSQRKGLCHGCGHDAHTAMLLTAAKILNEHKDKLHGEVKLIFQPAEELGKGAALMIKEGNFIHKVDSIMGIHMAADLPTGIIATKKGPMLSSSDMFRIHVLGKGGHSSSPHNTIDALLASCAIVTNAQSVVSREIDPFEFGVITFGVINSGSRFNIIAESGTIEGTVRSYNKETRNILCDGLKRFIEGIAASYKAKAELDIFLSLPATVNTDKDVEYALESAKKVVPEKDVLIAKTGTGSEDFSYYLEKVPGVFVNIGSRNEEKGIVYPHHSPHFDIDEDALPIGSAMYVQYAVDFLNDYSNR